MTNGSKGGTLILPKGSNELTKGILAMRYNELTTTAKSNAVNWWVNEFDVFGDCETLEDIEYSLQYGGFEFTPVGKVIE